MPLHVLSKGLYVNTHLGDKLAEQRPGFFLEPLTSITSLPVLSG